MERVKVSLADFNSQRVLPFDLRVEDFALAMQDVYDFLYDVNALLAAKGVGRFDDFLRPAAFSGIVSDMLTASLARKSRMLVENRFHNGHPDLIRRGIYANDAVRAGSEGVEIKTTRKAGGAVDFHGARPQWLCVFVYKIDSVGEPASKRAPTQFSDVYLQSVELGDFRKNKRGELGTHTASLNRDGLLKLRAGWLYHRKSL